jgi:predicted Zn-dependent protease
MSKSIRFASAALVLAAFVAGCGTDEETLNQKTVSKNDTKTTPSTVVETTPEPAPPVAVTPPAVEATYQNSETAFLEGRYDEAFDLFTIYTAKRSENPWGHYMLGMSAWKSGRLDEAQTAFTHAIELDSTLVKAHLNLARVLLESHQPAAALTSMPRPVQRAACKATRTIRWATSRTRSFRTARQSKSIRRTRGR